MVNPSPVLCLVPLTLALSHPFPRYLDLILEFASKPPQARITELHKINSFLPLFRTPIPFISLFFFINFLAAISYLILIPFFLAILVSDFTRPSP